jgi:hypothetical protein
MTYNWTKEEIVRFFKESGMDACGYHSVDIANDSELESKVLKELKEHKRVWAAMPARFPWRDTDGKLTLIFNHRGPLGFYDEHGDDCGFYYITSLYTKIVIDEETDDMRMCAASEAWTNKIKDMKPDELTGYMKYKIIQAAKKAKQLKMDQIKTCGGDYEV